MARRTWLLACLCAAAADPTPAPSAAPTPAPTSAPSPAPSSLACVDTLEAVTFADTGGATSYTCAEVFFFGFSCEDSAYGYSVIENCCDSCRPDYKEPTVNATNATKPCLNASALNATEAVKCFGVAKTSSKKAFGIYVLAGVGVAFFLLGLGCCVTARIVEEEHHASDSAPASLLRPGGSLPWRLGRMIFKEAQLAAYERGVVLTGRVSRADYLGALYCDHDGAAHSAFNESYVFGNAERVQWLDAFARLDPTELNRCTVGDFLKRFGREHDALARRLFDTFSTDGFSTDVEDDRATNLIGFVKGMFRICLCDQADCRRLAFRLLAMRGFKPGADAVVDVADLREWVVERYGPSNTAKKKALQLARHLEAAGSNGVAFRDFDAFCDSNNIFLLPLFQLQMHLRCHLFGNKYWDRKSRRGNSKPERQRQKKHLKDLHDSSRVYDRLNFDFWTDFPRLFLEAKAQRDANARRASLLNGVGDSLRAHLYGKLLAAVEDLLTDGHSVSGAFARWRAKASRLRLKDDAVVELGPAAVHRKIVQATHRLANPKAPDLVDLLVSDYASRAQAWATSIDAAPRASPGPASKAYTASRLTSSRPDTSRPETSRPDTSRPETSRPDTSASRPGTSRQDSSSRPLTGGPSRPSTGSRQQSTRWAPTLRRQPSSQVYVVNFDA